MGIGGIIRDYCVGFLEPFQNLVRVGHSIEAKALALLEKGVTNHMVERDSITIIAFVFHAGRSSWRYDWWLVVLSDC